MSIAHRLGVGLIFMEQQGITAYNPPGGILAQTRQQMNNNAPVLNQVSQDSPLFQPSLQTPPQAPMPEKSPMDRFSQGLTQQAPTAQPNKPQQPPKNPLEARRDLIIKALTNHLAALDKQLSPDFSQSQIAGESAKMKFQ